MVRNEVTRNALYEEIDRLKAEIAKKDAEFTVNAKMLARQTDLAREAEVNLVQPVDAYFHDK